MLINEFVFKEELLTKISQILRSYEYEGHDYDYIESNDIPEILVEISKEINNLLKENGSANFGK